MKKIISSIFVAVFATLIFAENSGNFHIPCYKCVTPERKSLAKGCTGCNAWRRYDLEKGQHEYMIYRCSHGHELKVSYKGDEKNE